MSGWRVLAKTPCVRQDPSLFPLPELAEGPASATCWLPENGGSLGYASLSEPKEIFLKKRLGNCLPTLTKSTICYQCVCSECYQGVCPPPPLPSPQGRGWGEGGTGLHRVRMSGAGVAPLLPGGNLPEESDPGVGRPAIGGGNGDAEDFRRLLHGQPNELAEREARCSLRGSGISPIDSLDPWADIGSCLLWMVGPTAKNQRLRWPDANPRPPLMAAGEFGQIMKRKLSRLSRRYASALRKHLTQGPQASLQPARGLGRQAVSLGLETLDVARIHEGALATLEASSSRDGLIKRAEIFFTEAITPIEKTHRAALKANSPPEPAQPEAGRSHSGPGRCQPILEAGNRPAQDRGGRPEEKRRTLQDTLEEITGPAKTFAAPDPPDSVGTGGQTKEDQPRAAG